MKLYRIFVMVMVMIVVAGCGGPKLTPEQSAMIYGNLVVKGDMTEADKIGMPEDIQKKFKATYDANVEKAAVKMLKDSQVSRVNYAGRLPNILKEVQKKIEIKTETISKDGENATVKFSIRTVDSEKFAEEVLWPAYEDVVSKQDLIRDDKRADAFAKIFNDNLDKLGLVTEVKSFEEKFIVDKSSDSWKPADIKSFSKQLETAYEW